MLGYLSADIICSEKWTVFRERSSRKTVSYEEQIMSKDKYPSIFLPQMATIVFIILQIFFATHAVLKIREYLTIILRNRAEYRLILSPRGRRPNRLKSDDIQRDWSDNCFIIQQIDNKTRNIFKSFCRHFFTSLFYPTFEATYIAKYLLPTDDRYQEYHDHIWIVLQFVE